MSLQQDLIKLEKGFWEATSDPDYYRKNMADEGLAVFSEGIIGKDGAVGAASSDTGEWSNTRLDEPRLIQLTGDVAVLVYTGHAEKNSEPYSANAASVYVKREGEWKLALHTQSKTADVPAGVR